MDFACPKCSEIVKANDDQAGQPILCPKCETQIKVPGNAASPKSESDDQWSIFDEEEKFFEEQVESAPEVKYRTKADELEPIVDNDEEEAAKEKLEEQQAAAEAIAKTKTSSTAYDSPVSSSLTIDEKIEEEEKFKKLLSELPDDSPLKRKAWDRSSADEDALGALHLDGDSAGKIRAKCFICDSVSIVKAEKSGQTIVCSDCGSDVKVPTLDEVENAKPKNDLAWQQWVQKEPVEKQRQRKIDDELFSDVSSDVSSQPEGYGLAPADDDEYGLAPADESLLTPIVPLTFDEEVEPQGDPLEVPANVGKANLNHGGANFSSAETMPPAVPRPPQAKKDRSETVTSSLFEEMQAEKEAHFERLPWAKHIFGVMIDLGFVARCVMLSLAFAVTVSLFIFADYIGQLANVELLGMLLKMPAYVLSAGCLVCVFWLGQLVINSTIVGQKRFDDLGGFAFFEFLSSGVFVGLSFLLTALPGFILGNLIAFLIEDGGAIWIWLVSAFGSFTALALLPFPLISALANRSPYKIFNQAIVKSFGDKSEYWIEFYPAAGILAAAVCGTWFIGLTENWLLGMLMCLLLGLFFGIYFRMLGRLAGSVLNEDVKPKKKKESV